MRKLFTVLSLSAFLFLGFSKAQAYTAVDYYNAGLQLYTAQNYAQAVQYFDAAVQMDPTNMAALQGRANCYYTLGRYSEALADYQKVQAAMPSDALAQMIQTLQAKVTAAPGAAPGGETPTTFKVSNEAGSHAVIRPRMYRISPYISLLNLTDFIGNANAMVKTAETYQALDPSITESGSVPSIAPSISLEVENPLIPDLDFSFQIAISSIGTAQDAIKDNFGYSLTDSFNMFSAHIVLLGRYYLGEGSMQPWIAAGPLLEVSSINYTWELINGGTFTFNGPSNTGVGFGGQVQLGMDFKITDAVFISTFAGYQLASSSNFSNTLSSSSVPGIPDGSKATLMVVPTSQGNVIVPVANGLLCVSTPDQIAGSAAPPGTRPAVLDDSGIFGGFSVGFHL